MLKEIKIVSHTVEGLSKVYVEFSQEEYFNGFRATTEAFAKIFPDNAIRKIYVPKEKGDFRVLIIAEKKVVPTIVESLYDVERDWNAFKELNPIEQLLTILNMEGKL